MLIGLQPFTFFPYVDQLESITQELKMDQLVRDVVALETTAEENECFWIAWVSKIQQPRCHCRLYFNDQIALFLEYPVDINV